MRQLIFCFLSLIAINNLLAQSNHRFSKAIRGGNRAAAFSNAIMDNDTIVAYGSVLDSTWSAWLVKMDTSGNILSQHRYEMENQPEAFLHEDTWGLIKTSDGGYAMLGTTYFDYKDVLIKTKKNGELDFIKYYPLEPLKVKLSFNRDIIEIDSGYLVSSYKYYDKIGFKTIFSTFDAKGIKTRDTIFPTGNDYGYFQRKNKDSIFVGGTKIYETPNMLFLNNQGDIIGEKAMPSGLGKYLPNITKLNKGWITLTIKTYDKPSQEPPLRDSWLSGLDEDFNILWHKKITYTGRHISGNVIRKLDNNNYAALLTLDGTIEIPPKSTYDGAFIQKFNDKGDLLWNRLDTIFWAGSSCINRYVSALPLASGNIMVIGWAEKCFGGIEDAGAYAWVVKLSKDGCLLEPMCGIISTGETFDVQQFKAYPNPTQSSFNLSWNIPNHQTWYLLFRDYSGRILQKVSIPMGSLNYAIDVSNYASGLYFYELYSEGKTLQSGKIVVQQ